ncbi:E3 ORF A [Equine adenovirus 1]|uniref:E3 ORF A n=1 Tax=Equine adenovirus A serotype 1 TaxID=46916 RepID=A0A1B0XBD2_ADEE1|nr:E3 ORF A [Equine adenovirus 1]
MAHLVFLMSALFLAGSNASLPPSSVSCCPWDTCTLSLSVSEQTRLHWTQDGESAACLRDCRCWLSPFGLELSFASPLNGTFAARIKEGSYTGEEAYVVSYSPEACDRLRGALSMRSFLPIISSSCPAEGALTLRLPHDLIYSAVSWYRPTAGFSSFRVASVTRNRPSGAGRNFAAPIATPTPAGDLLIRSLGPTTQGLWIAVAAFGNRSAIFLYSVSETPRWRSPLPTAARGPSATHASWQLPPEACRQGRPRNYTWSLLRMEGGGPYFSLVCSEQSPSPACAELMNSSSATYVLIGQRPQSPSSYFYLFRPADAHLQNPMIQQIEEEIPPQQNTVAALYMAALFTVSVVLFATAIHAGFSHWVKRRAFVKVYPEA